MRRHYFIDSKCYYIYFFIRHFRAEKQTLISSRDISFQPAISSQVRPPLVLRRITAHAPPSMTCIATGRARPSRAGIRPLAFYYYYTSFSLFTFSYRAHFIACTFLCCHACRCSLVRCHAITPHSITTPLVCRVIRRHYRHASLADATLFAHISGRLHAAIMIITTAPYYYYKVAAFRFEWYT